MCKPCGESYVRRPVLQARMVPLHVHTPTPPVLIIEGHRLVDDPEHGSQCYDCGATGTEAAFRCSMLCGCPARPESINHLFLDRYAARLDANGRAEASAGMWFDYAVHYIGLFIGDWRVVLDDPTTCATFTFRDREYRVVYDLTGYGISCQKLENRGRPAPEIINPEHQHGYKQVAFHFHRLVTDSGAMCFATYTPGREDVILYAPEGAISAVLRFPELDGTRERRLAVVTDAVCDTFGAIADITLQTRIYE
ncbi:hypothetical protein ACWDFH_19360 [Streptomyces kronopolitis]